MGKASTRVVLVPRWATVSLLLLVSAAMALLILELSGRAYLHERTSIVEVLSLVRRYDRLTQVIASLFTGGQVPEPVFETAAARMTTFRPTNPATQFGHFDAG